MELTKIQKNKLIKSLQENVDEIQKIKYSKEFKTLNLLKKSTFKIVYIFLLFISMVFILVGAILFVSDQHKEGVAFINKVFGSYTELQIWGIFLMAIGPFNIVLLFLDLSFAIPKKIQKIEDSYSKLLQNKKIKFWCEIGNNIKKLYSLESIVFAKEIWKKNFWINLEEILNKSIEFFNEVTNLIDYNEIEFIKKVEEKVSEDALIRYIDSIW